MNNIQITSHTGVVKAGVRACVCVCGSQSDTRGGGRDSPQLDADEHLSVSQLGGLRATNNLHRF